MIDAERLGFEVGKDAADPRQDDMGGHVADDVGMVALCRHSRVGRPADGLGRGGRGDVGLDEGVQDGGGEVVGGGEADASRPSAFDFDGAGDELLARMAASLSAGWGALFGSRVDRCLAVAAAAFVSPWLDFESPGVVMVTGGTAKSFRPADRGQIGCTGASLGKRP